MRTVVAQLPDRALTDPSLLCWIAGEVEHATWAPTPVSSYEHYFEHISLIHAWVEHKHR
jgi:hypothetical protein